MSTLYEMMLQLASRLTGNWKDTRSEQAKSASEAAVEHSQGRELTPEDKSFAGSLAKRIEGKGGENSDIRKRLTQPPKGLKWGNRFETERDAAHCLCGRPKIDHTPERVAECPYKRKYRPNGERLR